MEKIFSEHCRCFIIISFLLLFAGGVVNGQDSYVFVIGRDPATHHRGMWMKRVFDEAFKRAGIKYTIKYEPLKRASISTDREFVDGDIYRVKNYNNKHSNLYRVPEPTFVGRISAFSANSEIELDNEWESFKDTGLLINYQLGNKIMKENLEAVVESENLEAVYSVEIGLRKLQQGRIDILVAVDDEVKTILKRDEFKNYHVHMAGPMVITPVHAFFLKKHKTLADRISVILKEMKQEGLVEKYRIETNKALSGK